nr:MAG TPA: hypothetical protein [Caudoviricetes sp.]
MRWRYPFILERLRSTQEAHRIKKPLLVLERVAIGGINRRQIFVSLLKKKEAYVTKGNRLIEEKRLKEATEVVVEGLNFYQNKVIKAVDGHPIADTALVVVALRHMADQLEQQEPSCRGLVKWLNKITTKPELQAQKKIEKTRKR